MGQKSPDVDAYIAAAQPFARPLLEKIRKAFHAGCPEVREVMKWSFPHFECDGLLGSMAGFKAHVSLHFWKGGLMRDPEKLLTAAGESRMSGMKIRSADELPSQATLAAYVREAASLNKEAAAAPKTKPDAAKPRRQAKPLEMPRELETALAKTPKARETFASFSQSQRNDYIEWISSAKQPATREKRLATTLEWLGEGKPMNWKYMKEWR